MIYKYVNKKNISTTIGGINFTPYSGYTSTTTVPALDVVSNGWDFDRYIDEVLSNTSNDQPGESKTLITGTKNLYVSTTGSNGNSGELGSPFRTIQYALDYISKYYKFGNRQTDICIINIADGTYEEAIVIPTFTNLHEFGLIKLVGNITTLDSVILYAPTTSTNALLLSNLTCNLSIEGLTIDATRVANYGNAIRCGILATLYIGTAVKIKTWSGVTAIYLYDNSYVNIQYHNFTLEGAARTVFFASTGGKIDVGVTSLTLISSSAPQFVYLTTRATMYFYSGSTVGSFTGAKYKAYHMSMLMLDGADTMIPGVATTKDASSAVEVF